jgi:hypothetical protein
MIPGKVLNPPKNACTNPKLVAEIAQTRTILLKSIPFKVNEDLKLSKSKIHNTKKAKSFYP